MPQNLGRLSVCAQCPSVLTLGKRHTGNSSASTRLTSHRRKAGPATGKGRTQHMQVHSSQGTAHTEVPRVDMQVKKITAHITACRSRQQLPQSSTRDFARLLVYLVQEKMKFLRGDLKHLFDDQGIDQSAYDDKVNFEDPITRYSTVKGVHLQLRVSAYRKVDVQERCHVLSSQGSPGVCHLSQDTCSTSVCCGECLPLHSSCMTLSKHLNMMLQQDGQ